MDAIRNDKPYNEIDRGIKASIVTSMGRFAAHTGQLVTYDEWLANEQNFAPDRATMTMDGPAPVTSDANGRYPIPKPGELKKVEYKI